MSDRTPSQIWHEISTLLQFPDINEDTMSHKQLDLPKENWLMCLTPQVRSTLCETDTCDTSKLVEEADKRHNVYITTTYITKLPTSDITTVLHRPMRPAQSAPHTEPFICWYLPRYGDKAKKCLDGCQYQPTKLIRRSRLTTTATTYET